MEKYLKIVCMILIIFSLSVAPSNAEKAWWEKGISIIKGLSDEKASGELGLGEIAKAFKEALRIGSENVVNKLGNVDGFNADPSIHIPLPEEFQMVKTMLEKIGMSQLVDDLELKLNRAAETATPKAKSLFLQSITEMTFDDVKGIYEGPDDSATRYFQEKMTPSLSTEMRPMIENSLSHVGAIQSYDKVMGQYKTLPFVPDVKANLTEHVIDKGIEGIFYYIAKEEAAIRKDPAKQTTELLKRVFGKK